MNKFNQLYESIMEDKDDFDEKYKKWDKLVNMSPSELESFLNSDEGKEAGLSRGEASDAGISSGRDSARAILRMMKKKKEDWNETDKEWLGKQISFISRMRGNKGPLRDEDGKPTRKLLALKIWGHDPEK
jgi:hypothetical protein